MRLPLKLRKRKVCNRAEFGEIVPNKWILSASVSDGRATGRDSGPPAQAAGRRAGRRAESQDGQLP